MKTVPIQLAYVLAVQLTAMIFIAFPGFARRLLSISGRKLAEIRMHILLKWKKGVPRRRNYWVVDLRKPN